MPHSSGLRRYARVVGAAAGAGVIASALTAVTPGAFAALPDPTVVNQGNPDQPDALNGNAPAPDGGVYSVGYEVVPVGDNLTNRAILITKSNADGSLDTSFGTGGRKTIDLVSTFHESITENAGAKELANGIAVDSQDRLMIVGQVEGVQSDATSAADTDVFVARLHPNGSLDASYGSGGWRRIDLSDGLPPAGATTGFADAAGWDIYLRPNRKAIISAAIGTDSEATRTARDAAAVQLTINGNLDSSFGDGGVASIPTPFGDNLRRGLLDDDGSYFTTAYANVGSNNQPFIQKFTPDGEPDVTWGDDGLSSTYPGGNGGFAEAYGMAKDADGNYIVSGYGYKAGRTGDEALNSVDAILFSLKPDGTRNRAWGDDGFRAYHFGANGNNSGDRHRDHVILPDGRIVGVGGSSGDGTKAIITVTNADGSAGETQAIDFGGTDDQLWGLTTIGDGYTIAASGWGNSDSTVPRTADSQVVILDLEPETVTKAATRTSVKLPKQVKASKRATATVKVTADDLPAGVFPTGKVKVTTGSKTLGSATLKASDKGSVKIKLAKLKAKTYTVKVTYAGNADLKKSSDKATLKVVK